jgi:hypothetical protein
MANELRKAKSVAALDWLETLGHPGKPRIAASSGSAVEFKMAIGDSAATVGRNGGR